MESLFTHWRLDGPMALFLAGLLLMYGMIIQFRRTGKAILFLTGFLLVILCVASPLRFLGEHYLMSAHMISHVVLLLIAAPLMVMGIPSGSRNKWLTAFSDALMKRPWIGWICGVCIMWFWHIPIVFNELSFHPSAGSGSFISNGVLQDVHLISLVIAGIIFSWTIAGPVPEKRMPPLNAVLYLSLACIFCSILGLLVTFAPAGVYTRYVDPADHSAFLNMIRNQHGMTAQVDQQVAGLIMWVPGCLIYLTASMWMLMKWFRQKNEMTVYISDKNQMS